MAWDIYGNNLREGFCEVHPHVNEYYPCWICCDEIQKEEERQREYDLQKADYDKAMEQEYHKAMEEQQISQLKADKEELQNWKDSAMEVMNDLNLQEIAKVLKLELGTSISKQLFSKVSELVADKEKLLEGLDNSLKVIEWYMENTMPESDNHTDFFNIGMNQRTEIESLIQKHKQ